MTTTAGLPRPARRTALWLAALLVPFAFAQTAALPAATTDALAHMVAEEKLAHDVYTTFADAYGAAIFANIAESEARHADAVRTLLDRYGLVDPTAGDAVGFFDEPAFQALYDQLIAQGSASLEAALQVGVAIEELDIDDLQAILDGDALPADVARVFENLLAGSTSHLAAFEAQLAGAPSAPADGTGMQARNANGTAAQAAAGGGAGVRTRAGAGPR